MAVNIRSLSVKSESENTMSKKLYIETYGCQMNVADSEVVASILGNEGYELTSQPADNQNILQRQKNRAGI